MSYFNAIRLKITTYRDELVVYAIALLAFLLPFSILLIPYLIGLVLVSLVFQSNLWAKVIRLWANPYLIIIVGFYLLHIIGLLHTENFKYGLFNIQVKVSLLILPVSFAIGVNAIRMRLKLIRNSFILGNLIAAILCIVIAVFNIIYSGSYFPNPDSSKDHLSLIKVIMSGSSYLNYKYLSAFIHVNYFAMYILLALYFLYEELVYRSNYTKNYQRFIILVATLFFGFFSMLLQSRSAILGFIIIAILESINQLRKPYHRIYKMVVMALCVLLTIGVLGFAGRTDRLLDGYSLPSYAELKEKEIRLVLWEMALPIVKKHPLVGVGTGDVEAEFRTQFNNDILEQSSGKYHNVHNEYLQTAMRLGLPVMLYLVFVITSSLLGWKHNTYLRQAVIFVIILMVSFLFESILNRLNGVVFFAFFYSYFMVLREHAVYETNVDSLPR